MIRIQIGESLFDFPTSWMEVTVRQFFQLRTWKDDFIELISILSGAPYEIIFSAKQVDLDEKLLPYLKFIESPLSEKDVKKHSTIKIAGIYYPIPSEDSKFTFGQKLSLQERMIETVNKTGSTIDCLAFAAAVYYQPIVQKKRFSTEDADAFAEEFIQGCSISEVWSAGNFFLKKSVASQSVIQPTLRFRLIQIKPAREFLIWISSKISRRSTRFRTAIRLNMKTS